MATDSDVAPSSLARLVPAMVRRLSGLFRHGHPCPGRFVPCADHADGPASKMSAGVLGYVGTSEATFLPATRPMGRPRISNPPNGPGLGPWIYKVIELDTEARHFPAAATRSCKLIDKEMSQAAWNASLGSGAKIDLRVLGYGFRHR